MTQTLLPCVGNAERAEANYATNLAELHSFLPATAAQLASIASDLQWIFARDGSLTAMHPGERWWGDCSLPRRAGRFMFKTMEIHGVVACFLSPTHAAHLRVTLDMLEPQQAVIAIVPHPHALWVMLHCEDFAADFRSSRLWFVTGDRWQSDLANLLADNPGLPTPSQFIRAISTDNGPADRLIDPAQKSFADESARRGVEVQSLAAKWKPAREGVRKFCVVAPTRFRLWNDAPVVLARAAHEADGDGISVCQFDSDNPSSASPLALARLIFDCDAVITANLSRADLPGVVPNQLPLITWITLPRIPLRETGGPRDRLFVADSDWQTQAHSLGWGTDEVRIAAWPAPAAPQLTAGEVIALIADTRPLDPPRHVTDFSSHLLLWELIRSELTSDPFLISDSAEDYLKQRMTRLRIAEEQFNKSFFIEHLIVPAYQQGLARLFVEEGLPLRLFGKGWEQNASFAAYAGGPVESREQFSQIVAASSALVHAWPSGRAHPIDATGRPGCVPLVHTASHSFAALRHRVHPSLCLLCRQS